MLVLAGIVLYNPNIERLRENINAILLQVDSIVFIDNGSTNLDVIKAELLDSFIIIENGSNLGIATALNKILEYAILEEFDWFITLDQDSVCMPELIENYKKNVDLINPGIISCNIKDRNFNIVCETNEAVYEIDECITSASFCNTNALKAVGGFDDKMFIDGVDFDICLNLRKHGYQIYKIDYLGILHEVGYGKNIKFLGMHKIVYNHSLVRNYYIARNHIYLAKKYPNEISMTKTILKEIEREILILFFEENKIKKIRIRHKAIKDGLLSCMGECQWL